jgi:1-acyl-sn-glycerol-3-phosphate acyltransferase
MKFKKMPFLKRMFCPIKELEQYHRDLREFEYENRLPIHGLKIRRVLHGLFIFIVKVECIFLNVSITVINDKSSATNRPVIYASTHIGRYDFESNFMTSKKNCYLFLGDAGSIYRNFDGMILNMNGLICTDTAYKTDRMIAKENCIKLLNQGGNLIIFPEGAWNITENQPVMNLFTGAVEMAIRSGAMIIPVAMENRNNKYYVNIGENIDYSNRSLEKKRELTDELRDVLCTLKWEIWENEGIHKRCNIPDGYSSIFLNNIMKQSTDEYTVDEIVRTRFRGKESSPEEAFSFMNYLIPKKENAFLLRDETKRKSLC